MIILQLVLIVMSLEHKSRNISFLVNGKCLKLVFVVFNDAGCCYHIIHFFFLTANVNMHNRGASKGYFFIFN